MNRRSFAKVISISILSALGLISLEGCVVRPVGTVGEAGPARRRRRRIRRRARRRIRRRMIGATPVFIFPVGTLVGDEVEMDDGKTAVVKKVDGKKVEIEVDGSVKSLEVEFED